MNNRKEIREEIDKLMAESEARNKKEVWVLETSGYAKILDRDSIKSAVLIGKYSYNSMYRLEFVNGEQAEYGIDYHTIKNSAEMGNCWAVPLLEAIEPLHQEWVSRSK